MNEFLKQKVDSIKALGLPVFQVSISGNKYIYKALTRREFRNIQSMLSKAAEDIRLRFAQDETKMNSELSLLKEKGEEDIFMVGLVDPEIKNELELQGIPAGVITRVSQLVMEASGFKEEETEEPTQL